MIWFFDDVFSEEDIAYLLARFKRNYAKQCIHPVPDLAKWMFDRCLSHLHTVDPTIHATYPHVTFSKHVHAIDRHIDLQQEDERYKVGIYLNDLSKGGTIFYTPNKEVLVSHRKGRVVLFDMSLPHAGEPLLNGETKYMIGFRVK
jgi:hypothetical protein